MKIPGRPQPPQCSICGRRLKWLRQGDRVTAESATEFRGQLYQCPRGHDVWWFDPWRQQWHAAPDTVA